MTLFRRSRIDKQAGLRPACFRLLILCVGLVITATHALAMPDSSSIPTPKDVFHPIDTGLGRPDPLPLDNVTLEITKRDAYHTQYRGLSELLARQSGAFPVLLGGFGQSDGISMYGASIADLRWMHQGRRLADPWTQSMQADLLSMEGLERVSLLVGSEAIGLAASPGLTVLSLQEAQLSSPTPYFRWWYSQGVGDFIATDVIASQNVAPNLNITLGVRRSGALGEFARTDYDAWNFRTQVRYTASERTSIAFVHQSTSHNSDLWGGVRLDVEGASLSTASAIPVYANLRDETRRHDIALTALHRLSDSSSSISATVWYDYTSLLRLRDSTLVPTQDDFLGNVSVGGAGGILVRYNQRTGFGTIRLGVAADHAEHGGTLWAQAGNDTRVSAFAHLDVPIGRHLTFRGASRFDRSDDGTAIPGIGAGLVWSVDSTLILRADASTTDVPTSAVDGVVNPERHTLFLADVRQTLSTGWWSAAAWMRLTGDAHQSVVVPVASGGLPFGVTTTNGPVETRLGALVRGRFALASLYWIPVVRAERTSTSSSVDLQGELSVRWRYNVAPSWVEIGLRGIVFAPTTLDRFIPTSWRFVRGTRTRAWVTNGLDAELVANVGNASVRLSYENILNQPFSTVEGHPAYGGNFRLSVTWAFFD